MLLIGTLLLFSFSSFALETDNYLVLDKELQDSSREINQYIQEKIEKTLNSSDGLSCEKVTLKIAENFKAIHPEKHPIELWLKKILGPEAIYPEDKDYVRISIYRDPFRFYLPYFNLSPNVQVGGVYFGTDKLIHFSSTGRRYLEHYLEKLGKGMSAIEATKSAIQFGLLNETTILGTVLTGVLSYGDVEANFQGFLFYKKFCLDQKDTYLELQGTQWILKQVPEIHDYVNPYWDETYNLSYYVPKNWTKVSKVIKEEHCPKFRDPYVQNRRQFYEEIKKESFSHKYVVELQQSGYERAPLPQPINCN